jgi:hypothetical protein
MQTSSNTKAFLSLFYYAPSLFSTAPFEGRPLIKVAAKITGILIKCRIKTKAKVKAGSRNWPVNSQYL